MINTFRILSAVMLLSAIAFASVRMAEPDYCWPNCDKPAIDETPHVRTTWTDHRREGALLEVPGWVFDAILRKRIANKANGLPVNTGTHFFWAHSAFLAMGLVQGVPIKYIAADMGRYEHEIWTQIKWLQDHDWLHHEIDWGLYL